MENVKDLLRTADALFTEMNKNSGDWDELRRRIMPRMEGKARQQEQANRSEEHTLNSSHYQQSRMPSSA